MIEYFGSTIRAGAGTDLLITARVSDDSGAPITTGVHFMLYADNDELLFTVDGFYYSSDNLWEFIIPAAITEGLKGRYWYCICYEQEPLCFKQPFYLIER